jgi:hypothetical protein
MASPLINQRDLLKLTKFNSEKDKKYSCSALLFGITQKNCIIADVLV